MITNIEFIELIKVIVLVSVLFVWVIRYDNIIDEFNQYKLPNWLRDLVGIIKLIAVYLINFSSPNLGKIGALAIAILMGAAIFTHIRVKNPLHKMVPSTTLMIISVIIFFYG
tara:strand:+ start:181 stop:516 length:336 start_codon:yes stop_codon:yes gene_type:complete